MREIKPYDKSREFQYFTFNNVIDHPDRKSRKKQTLDLNYTLYQMDLADTHTTLNPTAIGYSFSQVHTEYSPR